MKEIRNRKSEVGSRRSQDLDRAMGVELEPEDEMSEALVYGCFVGLLVFFLAAVAAILFL